MCLVSSTMQGQNIILLVIISVWVQNSRGAYRIDPLVDTNIGLIRGLRASDGEYALFTGIPYATVDETNPFGVSLMNRSSTNGARDKTVHASCDL